MTDIEKRLTKDLQELFTVKADMRHFTQPTDEERQNLERRRKQFKKETDDKIAKNKRKRGR